ncbi:toxin-antitoxin system YwqK family antitoxin [Reichenbachiella versicolor]|uniref:toxin-antitoxin system YwqK family antitoxin n=1 Tax=Reichenbachiella versicolor TaxID=1821036 RepID=UPI000D6E2A76|nr:hypothetical protein [Reichenbachiella versicolor]
MRFKYQLLIMIIMITFQTTAQNRKVETYYDLYKTKIHEFYTTLDTPPYRKHGLYKEFDTQGNLIRYKEFNDGKQDGVVRIYYFMPDYSQKDCYGKLTAESYWKDGKRHGWDKAWSCDRGRLIPTQEIYYEYGEQVKAKLYHRNGELKSENQRTGLNKEWDDKGNLIAEYQLVDGVEEGLKTLYHSNGQIKMKGIMKDGKHSGDWKAYHPNGEMMSEFTVNPNIPYFKNIMKYTDRGVLKESTIYDGNLHAVTLYDSLTGIKTSLEHRKYSSDNSYRRQGELSTFYNNGQVRYILEFNGIGQVVKSTSYDKSGEDLGGIEKDSDGIPIGQWVVFKNMKTNTITYAPDSANMYFQIDHNTQGYIESVKGYSLEGQLVSKGMFYEKSEMNYLEHGNWKYYHPSTGKVAQEGKFNYGKPTGEWMSYSESGDLTGMTTYSNGRVTKKETGAELEARQMKEFKSNLVKKYYHYSTKNNNPIVKHYLYNSSNTANAPIVEKASELMDYYLSDAKDCLDIDCLKSIETKVIKVEDVLKKYQSNDPGKLAKKLKSASTTEKIEALLLYN